MAEVKEPETPSTPTTNVDPQEQKRLQAMLGNPKQQEASYFMNEKGKQAVVKEGSVKPTATVFFKNCHDCEYIVDAMCTKIFVETCKNTKIIVKQKVVTGTIEIFKSDNFHLQVNTKIGTLQADICNKLKVEYQNKELFNSLIWAGVHDLELSFIEEEHTLNTGFNQMQSLHGELKPTIDQFIVRWVNGELLTEKVIRLDNGFPTTAREKKAFDERQEENLQKLAEQAGITIGRKPEKKIPPNSTCPKCDSGLKYKKCCGKA